MAFQNGIEGLSLLLFAGNAVYEQYKMTAEVRIWISPLVDRYGFQLSILAPKRAIGMRLSPARSSTYVMSSPSNTLNWTDFPSTSNNFSSSQSSVSDPWYLLWRNQDKAWAEEGPEGKKKKKEKEKILIYIKINQNSCPFGRSPRQERTNPWIRWAPPDAVGRGRDIA